VLAGRLGARTAALVAAVTNPAWEPGRGKYEQYREHILAALQAGPWAQVIKALDFTDTRWASSTPPDRTCPSSPASTARWSRPCACSSCARTSPLEDDVKGTIAAKLDAAQARLAAIRHDHHDAVPLLPGPAPARFAAARRQRP
jgi:hypothetical protein